MLKHQQTRNPSAFLTPTKIRWLTLAIGLVWYALSSAVHAQTSYTVTDLGTLGGDTSVAFSINNRGDVVGISVPFNSVFYHAFLYSGGQMQDLGTLGGESSEAFAINNRGDVVGFYSVPINGNPNDFINHAFLYSRGKIQELIAAFSFATDISNRGEITGAYLIRRQSPQDIIHAFLYTRGQLRDLGTLGGDFSAGSGINDRGQVVGDSFIAGNSADHAFLYSGGQMQDLGTLGGNSVALRINEHGQVVGYSYPDRNFLDYHAFLYTAGRMMDLGTLAGSS